MSDYNTIEPENVKMYDHVRHPTFNRPEHIMHIGRDEKGRFVIVEGLVNDEILSEEIYLNEISDDVSFLRPEEMCFSDDGGSIKDQLFAAYVKGNESGGGSRSVSMGELYSSLVECFKEDVIENEQFQLN